MTDKVTPPAAAGGTAIDPGGRKPTRESHPTSIAVWGVPSPVVVSRRFAATVGVKCAAGCPLAGRQVVVRDAAGADVGHGSLGESPAPGTRALYAAEVMLEAPAEEGVHAWTAAFGGTEPDAAPAQESVSPQEATPSRAGQPVQPATPAPAQHLPSEHAHPAAPAPAQQAACEHEGSVTTFGFRAVTRPEHRVTVTVVDRDTETRLAGAEVRVGVYRGTTDASGQAHVAVHPGSYDLYVRKAGYQPHADRIPVVSGDVIREVAAVRVTDADLDDDQVWM
ncbi:MAG: carboxypeptidase regulatory-like domain-containing protein [Acidobacteria bacterium]|nr:carboxypeptidase regulatory-like domain-containing protein [Acidobacteriota bacterium]